MLVPEEDSSKSHGPPYDDLSANGSNIEAEAKDIGRDRPLISGSILA
jgi:hypothetical protein